MGKLEKRVGMMRSGFMAAGAATAAFGGSIALLVSQFGQLDREFQTIQTTSNATTEQMEEMRDSVKRVGVELPVTMAQGAQAMKALSFAGLDASESMNALAATSELAVASGMSASQSAKTVAQSLNAFNMEADQANAIVGAMGATFSSSATNIRSLSQALTEVQATASSAGISAAETVAAVGTLADSGLEASKAGTSLNAVLSRLTGNSSETQKALEKLGLSTQAFTDSSGDLKSMTSILGTLSSEMDDVGSQAERIALAQQLVGREGARALLPLMEDTDKLQQKLEDNLRAEIQGAIGDLAEMNEQELSGVSQALGMDVSGQTGTKELITNLRELSKQGESTAEIASRLQVGLGLTDQAAQALASDIADTNQPVENIAEGIGGVTTAAELAEKQTQTLSGQIQQLRSTLQVLGYEIFQGTKPAVTAFVGALRTVADPISENETLARGLGVGLVALTGAAAAATIAFGAMYTEAKLAALAEAGLIANTTTGTAVMWAHSAAVTAASKAQWLMTASTGQLIAATTAKTTALWASVSALGASAAASLSGAGAMGVFSGAVGVATAAVGALWTALGPIGLLAVGLTAIILGLAGVMKTDLFGAGDKAAAALGWLGDAAGTVMAIFGQLLGIGYELARILGTALVKGITGAVTALTNPDLWVNAGRSIVDLITQGLAALGPAKYAIPILGPLLLAKDILTDRRRWLDAGQSLVETIVSGIKDKASAPVDAVKDIAGKVRNVLPFSDAKEGPLSTLTDSGAALVRTLAKGAQSEESFLVGTLTGLLEETPLQNGVGLAPDAVPGQGGRPRSAGAASGSGAGSTIEVTVNQENHFEGGRSEERTREIRQVTESAAREALSELELILKQSVHTTPQGSQ
ncbi:phage tail tape measure protein [Halorussus halobius]|uniref:phage tail tape measure protein n=1 Tax=Halorussus halobius TaxID=1710537 RepID=UPI00143D53B0|nr:phage tail tape measure protein [Halorussus halobius]